MVTGDIGKAGPADVDGADDGRGSWIPNRVMIATRCTELRKRRGLMITLIALTIGLPTLFLVIRLLLHASRLVHGQPAGGFEVSTSLTAGVRLHLRVDRRNDLGSNAPVPLRHLADGMFTQEVVTGRGRAGADLARIPAGLAIIVPMVAVACTVICAVWRLLSNRPRSTSRAPPCPSACPSMDTTWAADHPDLIICDFPYNGPCPENEPEPNTPLSRAVAVRQAEQNYPTYTVTFNSPPYGVMIRAGLWLELEVLIAYLFGLGLASLLGQRMVPIILMIVYGIIFRPFLLSTKGLHLINLQRPLVIELAVAHSNRPELVSTT